MIVANKKHQLWNAVHTQEVATVSAVLVSRRIWLDQSIDQGTQSLVSNDVAMNAGSMVTMLDGCCFLNSETSISCGCAAGLQGCGEEYPSVHLCTNNSQASVAPMLAPGAV